MQLVWYIVLFFVCFTCAQQINQENNRHERKLRLDPFITINEETTTTNTDDNEKPSILKDQIGLKKSKYLGTPPITKTNKRQNIQRGTSCVSYSVLPTADLEFPNGYPTPVVSGTLGCNNEYKYDAWEFEVIEGNDYRIEIQNLGSSADLWAAISYDYGNGEYWGIGGLANNPTFDDNVFCDGAIDFCPLANFKACTSGTVELAIVNINTNCSLEAYQVYADENEVPLNSSALTQTIDERIPHTGTIWDYLGDIQSLWTIVGCPIIDAVQPCLDGCELQEIQIRDEDTCAGLHGVGIEGVSDTGTIGCYTSNIVLGRVSNIYEFDLRAGDCLYVKLDNGDIGAAALQSRVHWTPSETEEEYYSGESFNCSVEPWLGSEFKCPDYSLTACCYGKRTLAIHQFGTETEGCNPNAEYTLTVAVNGEVLDLTPVSVNTFYADTAYSCISRGASTSYPDDCQTIETCTENPPLESSSSITVDSASSMDMWVDLY